MASLEISGLLGDKDKRLQLGKNADFTKESGDFYLHWYLHTLGTNASSSAGLVYCKLPGVFHTSTSLPLCPRCLPCLKW